MSNYNGWKNRETWLINVWFNPENESDVDFARETIETDYEALPDYMRDFVDLNAIDWDELRESVATDDDDDDDDEQ